MKPVDIQPLPCRCGGKPSAPKPVLGCNDRWMIRCGIERCQAANTGQGLKDVVKGWNRLAAHMFR